MKVVVVVDDKEYQLLFANDRALLADTEVNLCRLVTEFSGVGDRRKLHVLISTYGRSTA